MFRRMFAVIRIFFSPRLTLRRIEQIQFAAEEQRCALMDEIARFDEKLNRAVMSRVTGTYRMAYDEGFKDGLLRGREQGKFEYRQGLLKLGIRAPEDV